METEGFPGVKTAANPRSMHPPWQGLEKHNNTNITSSERRQIALTVIHVVPETFASYSWSWAYKVVYICWQILLYWAGGDDFRLPRLFERMIAKTVG